MPRYAVVLVVQKTVSGPVLVHGAPVSIYSQERAVVVELVDQQEVAVRVGLPRGEGHNGGELLLPSAQGEAKATGSETEASECETKVNESERK
jgi:hypothetical protein